MQTFLGPTVGVAFFFLLGVAGLLKMRSEKRSRLDLPFAATVTLLLLVGASLCASSIYSFTLGSQTIVRRLTDKAEIVSTTSRGATSRQYRLYFGSLTMYDVPDSSILDKMTKGECYRVAAY